MFEGLPSTKMSFEMFTNYKYIRILGMVLRVRVICQAYHFAH